MQLLCCIAIRIIHVFWSLRPIFLTIFLTIFHLWVKVAVLIGLLLSEGLIILIIIYDICILILINILIRILIYVILLWLSYLIIKWLIIIIRIYLIIIIIIVIIILIIVNDTLAVIIGIYPIAVGNGVLVSSFINRKWINFNVLRKMKYFVILLLGLLWILLDI